MNKLVALYRNEMVKIIRKVSILVILIVLTVVCVAAMVLYKISSSDSFFADFDFFGTDGTQEQLEYYRSLDQSDIEVQAEIERLESLAKLGLDVYEDGYVQECAETRVGLRLNSVYERYLIPEERINELIDVFNKAIASGDYKACIDADNQLHDAIYADSRELSGIYREVNELLIKCDPTGESYSVFRPIASELAENRICLYYDDNDIEILTAGERDYYLDNVLLSTYKLENGIDGDSSHFYDSADISVEIGLFMLAILSIILAGSSISQEIATGSIKALIISPVKRWKIFAAKLASIVTVSTAVLLYVYLLSFGLSAALFGSDFGEYIYISGGAVHSIAFPVKLLLSSLLDYVDILIYIFFAYMLSSLTRNTALSVGISMAVYFCSGLISTVSALILNKEIFAFLPFANLSLSSRVFASSSDIMAGTQMITDKPIIFSVVYLAVFSFCMLFIAYDSFVRRDV